MLRKLLGLTVAVGMLSLMAGSVQAGVFLPHDSTLQIQLGSLPAFNVTGKYQYGGWATLANNGGSHDLSDTPSIWRTTGYAIGTSLLTGVSLLDRLTFTGANASGSFTASFSATNPMGGNLTASDPNQTAYSGTLCPNGCLGGAEGFTGKFILGLGALNPTIMLTGAIGIGGFASLPIGQGAILVTAAPFITGKARLTGVTTNVISLPNRGASGVTGVGITLKPAATEEVRTFTISNGFITNAPSAALKTRATVTFGGTNALGSASSAGQVTLVSPLRIDTAGLNVGIIPGYVAKTFVFVPEPGTVLLLVSGAAGLVFIGRKRMKG
jgi:hypothetical protein